MLMHKIQERQILNRKVHELPQIAGLLRRSVANQIGLYGISVFIQPFAVVSHG